MAALSVLRSSVRDELGELTAGRWSDTQLNSWLNRGVDHLVGEFHRGKCYELLRPLIKYVEYTLNTSYTEYTMWDVINNSLATTTQSSTNTWYGYIHGMLGNYPLHVADAKEYHRLIATYGEFAPSTTTPWIYFSGKDRATKYLAYTNILKTTEPVNDGKLTGATGGATAYIAIKRPPNGGTWQVGVEAGTFYIYGDTGAFQAENLNYIAPKASASEAAIVTIAGVAVASVHDCPTFQIFPTLTTAAAIKLWFLNKPTAMSAATDIPDLPYDCDNLLVWWATAQAWQADQRFEMSDRIGAKFEMELQKKITDFKQTTFTWL